MADYTPIDCNYYDFLEHLATLRLPAEVLFKGSGGEDITITGLITNLRAHQAVEYMMLDNKTEIRLDRIVSVNKQPVPGNC